MKAAVNRSLYIPASAVNELIYFSFIMVLTLVMSYSVYQSHTPEKPNICGKWLGVNFNKIHLCIEATQKSFASTTSRTQLSLSSWKLINLKQHVQNCNCTLYNIKFDLTGTLTSATYDLKCINNNTFFERHSTDLNLFWDALEPRSQSMFSNLFSCRKRSLS